VHVSAVIHTRLGTLYLWSAEAHNAPPVKGAAVTERFAL
jgi:hypothetical protein